MKSQMNKMKAKKTVKGWNRSTLACIRIITRMTTRIRSKEIKMIANKIILKIATIKRFQLLSI